jgi:hypothetical protein
MLLETPIVVRPLMVRVLLDHSCLDFSLCSSFYRSVPLELRFSQRICVLLVGLAYLCETWASSTLRLKLIGLTEGHHQVWSLRLGETMFDHVESVDFLA